MLSGNCSTICNFFYLLRDSFPNLMPTLSDELTQISTTDTELWDTSPWYEERSVTHSNTIYEQSTWTGTCTTNNWRGPFPHALVNWQIFNPCQYTRSNELFNELLILLLQSMTLTWIFLMNRKLFTNQLTGTIPSSIGELTNLQYLSVHQRSWRCDSWPILCHFSLWKPKENQHSPSHFTCVGTCATTCWRVPYPHPLAN